MPYTQLGPFANDGPPYLDHTVFDHFEAGITNGDVSADKVVYVSGGAGDDTNTGSSPGAAFKTLTKAVSTLSSGGKIIVLPGNVSLTGTVTITQNNLTIEGAGANATQIIVNGNYDAFAISGAVNQVAIRSMWIGSFAPRTSGNGISIIGTSGIHAGYIHLDNLVIQNTWSGVYVQYADSVLWRSVRYVQSISGCQGSQAIFNVISSATHTFDSCFAVATNGLQNTGDGFRFDSDTDTMTLSKCYADYCNNGVMLKNSIGGSSTGPRLVRLTDCYFEKNTSAGVNITDGRDVRLSGAHTAANGTHGYSVTGGTSIKLMNCLALQNDQFGYYLSTPANDIRLMGCEASNNSNASANTNDGCYINTGTSHVRVMGCRFGDFIYATSAQRYGLVVGVTTDYIIVQGNDTVGNVTGGINNASTGTHNSITGNV